MLSDSYSDSDYTTADPGPSRFSNLSSVGTPFSNGSAYTPASSTWATPVGATPLGNSGGPGSVGVSAPRDMGEIADSTRGTDVAAYVVARSPPRP